MQQVETMALLMKAGAKVVRHGNKAKHCYIGERRFESSHLKLVRELLFKWREAKRKQP